jgi:hypothetical protein
MGTDWYYRTALEQPTPNLERSEAANGNGLSHSPVVRMPPNCSVRPPGGLKRLHQPRHESSIQSRPSSFRANSADNFMIRSIRTSLVTSPDFVTKTLNRSPRRKVISCNDFEKRGLGRV